MLEKSLQMQFKISPVMQVGMEQIKDRPRTLFFIERLMVLPIKM